MQYIGQIIAFDKMILVNAFVLGYLCKHSHKLCIAKNQILRITFSSQKYRPIGFFLFIFTALHAMQTRYSDENSVCLSVCPSVTRVYCDKTVERSVQILSLIHI